MQGEDMTLTARAQTENTGSRLLTTTQETYREHISQTPRSQCQTESRPMGFVNDVFNITPNVSNISWN